MNNFSLLFALAIIGVATSANILFLIALAVLEGHSLNARGYLILLASIICLTHSVYYLKGDHDDRVQHLQSGEQDDD